MFTATASAYCT